MNSVQKPMRRGPRIALALLLATVAAGGVWLYVNNVQQAAAASAAQAAQQARGAAATTARAKVVVATQSLAAGTALSSANVELRDVSQDAVQPNAVTVLSDAVGKALNQPVAGNQQILNQYLGGVDSRS